MAVERVGTAPEPNGNGSARAWLEALGQYRLLFAQAEREFDDLTRLAAHVCGCPLGFVSFLDSARQHYESKIGPAPTERFAELPLSAEAIRHDDLLVVPDTLLDERFAQNPLVIAEPHIRFFAAAPLHTPHGDAIGSLSVIDWEPRELSPEQEHALRTLGRQASAQIELLRLRLTRPREAITAELGGETELREIASLLTGALESTSEGILAVDNDRRIVVYNRRFAEMWQLPGPAEDDLRGVEWPTSEALAQLTDPGAIAQPPPAPGDGAAPPVLVLELSGGRVLESYALPRWVEGRVGGTMWRFRDISEKRRAEELLRAQEIAIRHAQRMDAVGRLTAGIAHDFNNVLTVIMAYADILAARFPREDVSHREAQLVGQAAMRAATLTGRLLAFSRKSAVQQERFDLVELTQGMEPLLHPLLRQVELGFSLPARPLWIEGDRSQIEQVLLNLVVNARDAMNDGGRIGVELAATGDESGGGPQHASLTVRDTGCGIPPEILPKIFEPFFTTKEVGRGTGLGLATVRGIVEQSGGRIAVSSEVGRGTAFVVCLPLVPGPAEAIQLPAPPARATLRRAIVLVVVHEEALRATTRRVLEEEGCIVLDAGNADDARMKLASHPFKPRLLLTDVALPGESGPELATKLTQWLPSLRVLYVSDGPAALGAQQPGAEDVLKKPFTPQALREMVARILRR